MLTEAQRIQDIGNTFFKLLFGFLILACAYQALQQFEKWPIIGPAMFITTICGAFVIMFIWH